MEKKEKAILDSAREFFFRYGYKKTSMDEIAEDAGIGKGTIYNYFKNKEDLFIRNGELKRLEVLDKVQQEMGRIKRADHKMLHVTLAMVQDIRETVKAYAMSKSVLEEMILVGMDLLGNHPEHIEQTVAFLQEGVEQGIFKVGDYEKKARLMNNIIKVFLLRWLTIDQQEAETEIRDIHELIFDGLRT